MQSHVSKEPSQSVRAFSRTSIRIAIPLWIALVAGPAGVTYWRFVQWGPITFYGDAPYIALATLMIHACISERQQAFATQFYKQYRPVSESVWPKLIGASGKDFGQDMLLHASRDHYKWTPNEGRFFELYKGQVRPIDCAGTDETFDTPLKKYPLAHACVHKPSVSFTPVVRPT
jgi:hypothetical protein